MTYFTKAVILSATLSISVTPIVHTNGVLLTCGIVFITFCISFLVLGFFGFIIDSEIESREFWDKYENSK